MIKKEKHIHKYKQVIIGGEKLVREYNPYLKRYVKHIIKTGGKIVFKCMVPGCSTFKDKNMVLSEKSICWTCNEEMIMTPESIKRVYPIHFTCKKEKVKNAKS